MYISTELSKKIKGRGHYFYYTSSTKEVGFDVGPAFYHPQLRPHIHYIHVAWLAGGM